MLKKLLITLIFCLGLGFGFSAHAASGTCPTDDGLGTGAGPGQYYCLGAFRTGQAQCPSWTGTTCATGLTCPTNCNGADSCGYCNSCIANYTLCGAYPSQTCTANTAAPANCSSFSQCTKVCSACAQGYELVGNACNGATLKLGSDSVGALSHLFQSTAPSVSILSDGKVGFGATPLDVFSIGMGGVAAPVGSLGTGHNNTMTYLTTDNYALVNYGTVKSMVGSASGLWGGALDGNIWNGTAGAGKVGIGTTNPGAQFTINNSTSPTLRFNVTGGEDGAESGKIEFFQSNYSPTYARASIRAQRTAAGSNGRLIFATSNTTNVAPTDRMIIDEIGKVGIGTIAPNDTLSIGMGGVSAPVGSLGTGHNNTMTYLSTDNYALVNYGTMVSLLINSGNTATVVSGGDLNMGGKNILNVNKLTVLTIDPLYNIKGINYSTYAPSISGGVKEECLGKVVLNRRNLNNEYEKIIDFSNEPEGTDLWVWRQVVDFNFDNIEVLLTPYGKFANTYYLIENNKLIFRSDKPITLSYRLIGNRFDWRKWPTKALDQTEKGTIVNLFD